MTNTLEFCTLLLVLVLLLVMMINLIRSRKAMVPHLGKSPD